MKYRLKHGKATVEVEPMDNVTFMLEVKNRDGYHGKKLAGYKVTRDDDGYISWCPKKNLKYVYVEIEE